MTENKKLLLEVEVLKKERDTLLAKNNNLESRLESEYKSRTRDFISKDDAKENENGVWFVLGFIVFLVIVGLSVIE